MKELNWKHIRKTVAVTTFFWPIFALAYAFILAVALLNAFDSITILLIVCFVLGVVTPAFVIGGASPDVKRKVLHGSVSAGLALPTAALSAFLLFSTIDFYTSPPSDERLIRRFERNEASFSELRDAAQTENGLTYHYATMERLGISSVNHSAGSDIIYFALDKRGSSTIKYYVYRKTPPPAKQIVKKISGSDDYVYRPIRDGWYLYVEATS